MKLLAVAFCAILAGLTTGLTIYNRSNDQQLGAHQCTWGPSYWCSNLTNAKGCHAVQHCIQTVWEKQTVPEDNDSICQICLDMVKQARDQLESNETQQDLRAVFEGSCKLIPLKPVRKECIKLADDFIPELVDALASQMNPQVVCSVAGLCNNAAIDQMLLEAAEAAKVDAAMTMAKPQVPMPVPQQPSKIEKSDGQLSCSECNSVASQIAKKFHSANRDDIVDNMLLFCGKMGSFSDACSNIILTYFEEIYENLQKTLTADSICHMSGVCSNKFHQHEGDDIEIRPLGNVGIMPVGDDIPCELCEQLVKHLRDVLIANTTETEFKQVLEGFCKQSGKFKSECLSIVDQYYDVIYKDLVNNLDANGACFMIGICKKGVVENVPIAPFLPMLQPAQVQITIKEKTKQEPIRQLLGAHEPKFTQEEIENMQLPIDVLVGAPNAATLVNNGETCTLCEYFLHFVQEALATPSNEEEIKKIVGKTCDRFPKSLQSECHNFVDMYGDACIALLIQGIDPSEICPKLKMCPSIVNDMEVFSPKPVEVQIQSGDKPSCPLCLLAVKQLQEAIKTDKSKENIKHALDSLCTHLPKKLAGECTDFVETYSSELVEMLITDFSPQQICSYLKLCDDTSELEEMNIRRVDETDKDILTNDIPDETINGQHYSVVDQEYSTSPQCLLCERIIKDIEKEVVNKKSREQIKHALEHICHPLKKLRHKCESFIAKHGDQITDLIMKELGPKEICRIIGACFFMPEDLDIDEAIHVSVIAVPSGRITLPTDQLTGLDDIINIDTVEEDPPCLVCEFVMMKLESELKDKKTQEEIKQTIRNICTKMPHTVNKNCQTFINKYADLIIDLIDTTPPKEICTKINLCAPMDYEITDEVMECGVCHGAVVAVNEILRDSGFDGNTASLTDKGCNSLPGQYYGKCSEMLKYYGVSIVNMLQSGTEIPNICPEIGMCFKKERSGFEFVMITSKAEQANQAKHRSRRAGADPCSFGPDYWCENKSNAEKCDAVPYCTDSVWTSNKMN